MAVETVRIEGLAGVLDTLRQLPPEVVSKNGGVVRKALRKAAKVLQVEMQANVQKIVDQPNAHGEPTESIGLLKKSIVIARGKQPVVGKGERVFVKVKRNVKYPPHLQNPAGNITAAQIGRQLETGTERRDPMPWVRPAFDSKKMEALNMFVTEIKKEITRVIKKLEAQNKGKK
jgi:HK97 gp10 family phage protein